MKVSFEGIGNQFVTFCAEADAVGGQPVQVTANGTVGACAAGARFAGAAVHAGDGYATVQIKGYITLPYSGTAPAVGFGGLSADGAGGVRADSNGGTYLIAEVDTVGKTVGFFM